MGTTAQAISFRKRACIQQRYIDLDDDDDGDDDDYTSCTRLRADVNEHSKDFVNSRLNLRSQNLTRVNCKQNPVNTSAR